jgi:hypothetical protein
MRVRRAAPGFAFIVVFMTFLLAGAGTAAGADVNLRARLILASNDPAPQDSRLEDMEYKLRRVFGFEY